MGLAAKAVDDDRRHYLRLCRYYGQSPVLMVLRDKTEAADPYSEHASALRARGERDGVAVDQLPEWES